MATEKMKIYTDEMGRRVTQNTVRYMPGGHAVLATVIDLPDQQENILVHRFMLPGEAAPAMEDSYVPQEAAPLPPRSKDPSVIAKMRADEMRPSERDILRTSLAEYGQRVARGEEVE